MRFFIIFLLSIGLTACSNPSYFPTSYAHHGKVYKSAPGHDLNVRAIKENNPVIEEATARLEGIEEDENDEIMFIPAQPSLDLVEEVIAHEEAESYAPISLIQARPAALSLPLSEPVDVMEDIVEDSVADSVKEVALETLSVPEQEVITIYEYHPTPGINDYVDNR